MGRTDVVFTARAEWHVTCSQSLHKTLRYQEVILRL